MSDEITNEERPLEVMTLKVIREVITNHPDAYPFVLEMLNGVLIAGMVADTMGGSEPDTLRSIAHAIREVLKREDPFCEKFITAV
jgi:hypothetical protein